MVAGLGAHVVGLGAGAAQAALGADLCHSGELGCGPAEARKLGARLEAASGDQRAARSVPRCAGCLLGMQLLGKGALVSAQISGYAAAALG